MRRIKTGICGLDELIGGGFPAGRTYLVCGEAGAGKTTFALQFIRYGALNGEPGVYLTIDEKPEHIIEDAASLGWDFEKLIEENLVIVAELTHHFVGGGISADKIIEEINAIRSQINAVRLAIDPIAPLILETEGGGDVVRMQTLVRSYIRRLVHALDEMGITTIATSEIPTGTNQLSRYGIEEFVASGVIVLNFRREGMGFKREIYIRKLRGVNHSMNVYNYVIQKELGIVISI